MFDMVELGKEVSASNYWLPKTSHVSEPLSTSFASHKPDIVIITWHIA